MPFSLRHGTVWHGDSLAVAHAHPADTLAAIYIDPPFGTGIVRRGRADHAYRDVDGDPRAFVTWLTPWLQQSHRTLHARGSLFVHLDYRTVHYIKVALDEVFGRDNFINELIWCYAVGGKSQRTFARKHDTILWYAKSADYAFYPEAVRVARRGASHMKVIVKPDGAHVQQKRDRKTGKVYEYPVAAGKIPEDWWADIEVLNHSDRERNGWPSQKPTRLLQRILKAVTQPGDTVADWFGGSGTTALVAQQLGCRFVTADQAAASVALMRTRLQTE